VGVRLSVAELRRLLPALHEAQEQREQRLWWSRFRRRHQAIAQRCHVIRRARQAPRERPPGPDPLRVPSLPELTPALWTQIAPLLPRSRRGRPARDHRLMVEPTFRTPKHALFAIFYGPGKPRLFLASELFRRDQM
jgi:hypothetical protein